MNEHTNGRRHCRMCSLPTWGGSDLCPDCQQIGKQPPPAATARMGDLWSRLAAPFDPGEVKHRPQGKIQLSYVTARTVMNRLDEVLGPANWWDSYRPMENSVLCTLTIRLPDGSTVAKQDAGGYAGMSDQGDDDKSGYSDGFKRAAVKFGVGRYLYGDGVPSFASPTVILPSQICEPPAAQPQPATNGKRQAPRNGRELYDYAVSCKTDPALTQWISQTFEPEHYPHRLVQWTEGQVMAAWPRIRAHLMQCKAQRDGAPVNGVAH